MIDEMTADDLKNTILDLSAVGTDGIYWERQLTDTVRQTNGLLAQMNSMQKNT
jgi:hypothetical protein